jgi:hypothetical protein
MTARRNVIALAAALAAFMGALVLGLYLFLKPLPPTPIPDWQATYRALMADGRRDEAKELLNFAQTAQDPASQGWWPTRLKRACCRKKPCWASTDPRLRGKRRTPWLPIKPAWPSR